MKLLGFERQWIGKIMQCVQSEIFCSYKWGTKRPYHSHTRSSVRDPLSPYLFSICTEGLSILLAKEQMEKTITGIWISRGAPLINHMLFIDDSILFYKADMDKNKKILTLLKNMRKPLVNR